MYKGGVIQNSEFNSGLMGWSTYRNIKAGVSSSPSGNKFAVVRNAGSFLSSSGRFLPSRSVYQRVHMQGDMHYSLSGMYTRLICREFVHSFIFLMIHTCFRFVRAHTAIRSMAAGFERHGPCEGGRQGPRRRARRRRCHLRPVRLLEHAQGRNDHLLLRTRRDLL